MAAPWYGYEHKRIQAALLASGLWLNQPCPRCSMPMLPGQKLDLDHKTDEFGRRAGGYNGLARASCNQRVNAWGRQKREGGMAMAPTAADVEARNHRGGLRLRRESKNWRKSQQAAVPVPTPGGRSPGREW